MAPAVGFASCVIHVPPIVSSSSRLPGVESDGGSVRQAAVSAGAVPEGSVPPAVNQQAVRGRRPAAFAQVLQVRPRSSPSFLFVSLTPARRLLTALQKHVT